MASRAARSVFEGDARAAQAHGARRRRLLWVWAVAVFSVMALATCSPAPLGDTSRALVIRSGGTYSGDWESLDPNVPAVFIRTSEPVIIENSTIRGRGHLIATEYRQYAHVTVRNVHGEALPPAASGHYPGRFLHADTYAYVRVENSVMIGTSGIYADRPMEGSTVQVLRNRAVNIDGRLSNGRDGYRGRHLVQFVQIANGRAMRDTFVAWNEVINEPYASAVEDVVNLFNTTGRADDPVRVHDNFIFGAYASDPTRDGYSGGGIMLGDYGGGYQVAEHNQVIATSNYGVAISGGVQNIIRDNRVVSCGRLPDGSLIAAQNVGVYIWNFYDSSNFRDNAGIGNVIGWTHPEMGRNDAWVPNADVWSENTALQPSGPVACEAQDEEIARWLRKVAESGQVIGLSTP